MGKTNVPYLSGDLQSYNDIYGTTNNPWALDCGPGGSSGGSAASLAAGFAAADYGSDIGGSIRTPAHLCGIFGHKPSFDIVPKRGHLPGPPGALSEGDLSVSGPLARSAEDLRLLLSLTAGPDWSDAAGWKLDLPRPRATQPKELRVAVWIEDEFCDIDAESAELRRMPRRRSKRRARMSTGRRGRISRSPTSPRPISSFSIRRSARVCRRASATTGRR